MKDHQSLPPPWTATPPSERRVKSPLRHPPLSPPSLGGKGAGGLGLFLLLALLAFGRPAQADPPHVLVVAVHGTLWPGTATFVRRQLDVAYAQGASGVILDIDTTGGSEAAANDIKQSVIDHAGSLPVAAFVHDRALGPGALIAVVCKTLALSPGASLGGAGGVSKSDLKSAAEAGGRNPAVAAAFAGADTDLPALGVKAGDTLTLTAKQAQGAGYADLIASYPSEVAAKMGPGLTGARLVPVSLDFWQSAALWVTQPWVTIGLLALGFALILTEMLTLHSWGLAGIFGGLLVAAIFAAFIAVGAATWVGLLLFLGGCAFLLLETHFLPGHGWPMLLGLGLIFVGLFYALGGSQAGALYPATTSLLATLGIVVAFFLYLPRSGVWKRLGQPLRQTAGGGYVSSDDYTGFLGRVGASVSPLRPSGTAEIDGVRLPVVTEGDFVPTGARVQVVMVQGNRIVVRPE